jgi:ATP-dependent Clp protease ATP-binding subunit ClpC
LPFYFILILQEFFIHFKLENSSPPKKLSDNYAHLIECVDFKTRVILERHGSIDEVIKQIHTNSDIKYFNKLLGLTFVPQKTSISEEEVLKKAAVTTRNVNGVNLHSLDIYAGYLLLLDESNKILFQNDIAEKDVLTVLAFVRKEYALDQKHIAHFQFSGSGVFDFFVFGWSAQLSQYASNFTKEVLSQRNVKPVGRNNEYDLLITALSKNSSSNALLVGQAGVGKSAIVAQFVVDSNEGQLPQNVSNKIVFKLYAERLVAGINNTGDLEARFVELFSELSHAGNIVVYIPNIENIFGGGGLNMDISGALIEYLRSNRIKIIGSTTDDAFKSYIYPKQEVKELFDIVEVNEPDFDTVLFMALEKSKELERGNGVIITYDAVKEACSLSDSYANDGTALPGRAVRLLDDTIAHAKTHGIKNITKKEVRELIEEKTHIVLDKPNARESEKLLNLEKELHETIVSQDEAVAAISDAMRRVRTGMKEGQKPIASFLFLGPTGVGKTETAKALALSYFGDEKTMIRLDMSEYQNPDSVERLLGGLADKVLNTPFSLILLDEFEKAYIRILDLFLQVLDEGRLTDNLGRTVSFNNTIIIATSNAGSEFIREGYKAHVSNENMKNALIEKIQQGNIFKPELINRFDDVIVFKPLSQDDVAKVAKLFLSDVIKRISEQQITLTYDDAVLLFIANNSYSVEFGARNVKRFIEQSVENQLSKLILSKALSQGGNAKIAIENNSLVIKV